MDHRVIVRWFPHACVANMGFANDVEFCKQSECPVHRRRIDAGVTAVHFSDNVSCAEVTLGIEQHIPHELTRLGDPMLAPSKHGLQRHVSTLGGGTS